jgi:hypothetical protein
MAKTLSLVMLLLMITATVLSAPAQSVSGTLSGTVIDPSGAALAGARVTVRNNATDQTFTAITDATGRFSFSDLPVGAYYVRVEAIGLGSTILRDVAVSAGQSAQLSVEMKRAYKAAKPPTAGEDTWKGGETGRDLLVKGSVEVAGYGLYSYVLFAGRPTSESKPRYLAVVKACLDEIQTIGGLEGNGMPKSRLNVAYIPIISKAPKTVDENWVLDNYDYDRATVLLTYLPENYKRHQGPYLVSHTAPLAAESTGQFLYQDLSVVNERLATAWIQHFLDQASQEHFWEANKAEDFALGLRNFVADAAPDIENIKSATALWIQTFWK